MNYGDHIIHEMAVKAGAPYGSEVTKVVDDIMEGEAHGHWVLEPWTGFETISPDGKEEVHWMAGYFWRMFYEAARESVTVEVSEF